MFKKKLNSYLLFQVTKYFTLILFIFLSVAWLLQITRLFAITNFLHIDVLDVVILSFYLIPNLLTVIIPFILIFCLLLCFNKLNKDNELISIFSLGFGVKPLSITLFYFTIIIIFFFTLFNFYLAPKVYEIYKNYEYDLRNNLDFNKMAFSNFINLNKTTILDFNKENNEYQDIFINFEDENENIIYAKKGNIFSENNKYHFQLTNGFKISIDKNNQIEKLEFLNYTLKIDNKNINNVEIIDKNTFTIFDDLASKNYLNITFKIIDIILILFISIFFYKNNLKKLNLNSLNNVYFSISCIVILILNQILKNSEITIYNYIFLISSIILISSIFSYFKNKYEQN